MNADLKLELDARRLPANIDEELAPHLATAAGVTKENILSYRILKCSLDARKKPMVKILYHVVAEISDGAVPKRPILPAGPETEPWRLPENKNGLRHPLIVGSGPAGLLAALVLAEAGAEPVVLDCGRDVERRKSDIDSFFQTRTLNPDSNLLFGEGGAGTWSDGKLYTRVRDERANYVLNAFISAGALPEIRYYAHPHIGSDKLPGIIASIRNRIISLGGTFLWDHKVVGIEGTENFRALKLASGERVEGPGALIACGHSARDLILTLTKQLSCSVKGFQIGCRIEHPQSFVNRIQFGSEASYPALGAAEYLYSTHGDNRTQGATTFCMCPGGEILPAASESGTLATNGMSKSARDGKFANSAVISSISADLFSSPLQAFTFLRNLEKRVFESGGGDYSAPSQKAADFLTGLTNPIIRETSYRMGIRPARLDRLVPEPVHSALCAALSRFDRLAPGFVAEGILIGMETKVSSPVRFERNPETLESSMGHLYIGGEGCGMAGGIISAAIDGVKLAEAWLRGGCDCKKS